jgi:hypothetical protein
VGAAAALEIGGDAFFEVFGFADVEDGAEAVFHQVDAGAVGQAAQFFLEPGG